MSGERDSQTRGIDRWLGRFKFGQKLLMLPVIALVGYVVVGVLAHYFALENRAHLESIQRQFLPTLEASRDLEDLLEKIQRGLHDAAAAENADGIAETEPMRAEFLERIDEIRASGLRSTTEVAQLRQAFDDYYRLSARTTRQLIENGMSDALMPELARMSSGYNQIHDTLRRSTERDRRQMSAAFQSAIRANEQASAWNAGLSVSLTIILFGLSWTIAQGALRQLSLVSAGFERLGRGDMTEPVPVTSLDELGELGRQANVTTDYFRDLVRTVRRMSADLNAAAAQLSATSNQHQRGASEQSTAVEETQRTMQSILASTNQINGSLDAVLRNAEQTLAKNQLIAESIVTLSAQTDGITEVLSNIKDIANKAELLALNAALEGTKAGEVGRGFSLVATQMQRLAENVQRAVGDIKQLTEAIRRASSSSVLATEEGTKLATDTTRSAREIRLIMQQHQTGTQQVTVAMDDVANVAQQSAASSHQILASSEDLKTLSERLVEITSRFRVGDEEASERRR